MANRLLVGLGNPGSEYQDTRHNVGFMVLDLLRQRWGWPPFKKKGNYEMTSGRRDLLSLSLMKPLTYMNLSGQAVSGWRRQNPCIPAEVLCIVDEFALDLGKLRLRASGSAGGHNGLKSLIADLGTQEFPRLRLGIGPVPERWDPARFVLGRFASEEKKALSEMLERAADCIEVWLEQGLQPAMARFN
jgi:PTH1 family peptidyl-tRNA hydrolase